MLMQSMARFSNNSRLLPCQILRRLNLKDVVTLLYCTYIAFAFAFSCYWNVIYIGNVLKTNKLRLVKNFAWFSDVKVSVQYLIVRICALRCSTNN